jgi:surface antigen
MSMSPLLRLLPVAALLVLAGCATNDSPNYSQGPILGAMTPSSTNCPDPAAASCGGAPAEGTQVANTPPPSQMVATGVDNLDISTFTDPNAFRQMGDQSKAQAASAQYYALQFGRVGAARTWSGETGVSGQVSVGPFVKVNTRDCRDFTDIVNVGPKSFTKRGTACREDDGHWTVGSASAASGGGPPALTPPASGVGASG